MGDLRGLIEAVEKGNRWDNNALYRLLGVKNAERANSAFHGSLDAANALHEALLPRCDWSIDRHDGAWTVTISSHPFMCMEYGGGNSAGRCWLLAILLGLEAEDDRADTHGEQAPLHEGLAANQQGHPRAGSPDESNQARKITPFIHSCTVQYGDLSGNKVRT